MPDTAPTARSGSDRTSLYAEITARIIAELEAGRLPWVQPWGTPATAAPLGLPRNAATGRTYSGVNVLILWGAVVARGFSGQGWLTFRQALALGGHVRKGERGTTVVYADRFIPDDERRRARDTGDEPQAIPFLKRFTVFNCDQCEDLPEGIAVAPPPIPEGLILPRAEALIRRQCTGDYKVVPIRRKVRDLAGIAGRRSPTVPVVEQWLGISLEEAARMKPSVEGWQVNRWPLVERRMTRRDCLLWLVRHGYPEPPRSACIGCPFHSDAHWRQLRDGDPDAWADAVAVDRAIRTGFRGIRGEVYLHRSAVPLDEADLATDADRGQLDLWPNECEGLCGV